MNSGKGKNTAVAKIWIYLLCFLAENIASYNTFKYWFRRFGNGDLDVNDRPRSGTPRKPEVDDLETLLNENSFQTYVQKQLGVGQAIVPLTAWNWKNSGTQEMEFQVPWIVAKQHYPPAEYMHFIAFQTAQIRFFSGRLLLVIKSGLCTIILNADICEWTLGKPLHQW